LGQYVGNPLNNSFVISGGNITDTSKFLTFGNANSSPDVVCCSLSFAEALGVLTGGLADRPNDVVGSIDNPVTFTLQQATPATPLPAALPLFATGLGALGLLGWRRKRKARVSLLGVA
jgi:hypothetical protein